MTIPPLVLAATMAALVGASVGFGILMYAVLRRVGWSGPVSRWLAWPLGLAALMCIVVAVRPLDRFAPATAVLWIASAMFGLGWVARQAIRIRGRYQELRLPALLAVSTVLTTTVPQLASGLRPFSVSDTWTHLTYIERLSASDAVLLSGSHLPGEVFGPTFSPTEIFIASLRGVAGGNALTLWSAGALVFPFIAVAAFMAVLIAVHDGTPVRSPVAVVATTAFLLTFPLVFFVEGSASYWATGTILLLAFTGCAVAVLRRHAPLRGGAALGAGLICLMSINHPVEAVIAVISAVALLAVTPRNALRPMALVTGAWIAVAALSGFLSARVINASAASALTTIGTYDSYVATVTDEVFAATPVALLVAAGIGTLTLIPLGQWIVVRWAAGAAVAVLLLGPWNPLFFSLYRDWMGLALSHRVVYALPVWLVPGLAMGLWAIRGAGARPWWRAAVPVAAIFAILTPWVIHLANLYGFTGRQTYFDSDEQSQLALVPDIYDYLASDSRRDLVLTDTWTGAPIPGISGDFIVVHRPWTEGPEVGRWETGRRALSRLASGEARTAVCRWHVTKVIVNEADLPDVVTRQFIAAPWLLPSFRPEPRAAGIPAWLHLEYASRGVRIYRVEPGTC